MLDLFLKIRDLLDARERRNALLLLFMVLITGVFEAIGVGSLIPFLSVLSNPEVIQENVYLSLAYHKIGFSKPDDFLLRTGS